MECRFCLMPQETSKNPLVAPCACIGSVKYVHLRCLIRWRETTENEEAVYRCQLCLTEFELFRKWPVESVPDPGHTGSWFILSKPLIVSIIIHWTNTMMYLKNMENDTMPQYSDILEYFLYDNRSREFFFFSVLGVTIFYGLFYSYFIHAVRSKHIYARYWLKTNVDGVNPRNMLIYTVANCLLACYYTYPFGFLYFFALPKLFKAHLHIVKQMNTDAQEI